MPSFTYGNYLYLNYNDDIPKNHHTLFNNKQDPGITITYPMTLLKEQLKIFLELFVENAFFSWIQENVQVVAQ